MQLLCQINQFSSRRSDILVPNWCFLLCVGSHLIRDGSGPLQTLQGHTLTAALWTKALLFQNNVSTVAQDSSASTLPLTIKTQRSKVRQSAQALFLVSPQFLFFCSAVPVWSQGQSQSQGVRTVTLDRSAAPHRADIKRQTMHTHNHT